MNYEDGKYYDAKIIGIRFGNLGEKQTAGLEFALEMPDRRQDSIIKFLSDKSLPYTKERLIDLGCQASDLKGSDWLRKINGKLQGVYVNCKAKTNDKGRVKLDDLYLPKTGFVAADSNTSPFDAVPDDDIPPHAW